TRDMKVHNQQWLDDLGVHGGSAIPLVTGDFEVARLNRRYTEENIDRLIFPVLIKSIRQYCEKVIVPVRDKTYYPILREAGVWAVQGEFRPMRFEQCEKLIG
ncbi:TPA: EAL domain-containing protein, partial [Shigella sonnei]